MEQPSSGGGGSALLLRLFESDFFDVHLCVAYLKNYPHSIGITHYLVNRLRGFAADDVEFYWPQLCYLVITRPTPSIALENFILERCESDAHIAVIFAVCRRVYNRVQAIIFTDPPTPPPITPDSDISAVKPPSQPDPVDMGLPPTKLNAPTAMFVGLGILAASIAMPRLASTTGKVAVEQARRVDQITKSDSDPGNEAEDNSASDEDLPSAKAAKSTAPGAKPRPPATPNGVSRKNGLPTLLGDLPRRASTSKLPSSGKRQPSYVPGAPIEPSSASSASAFLSSLASLPQSKSHTFLPTTTTSSSSSGSAEDRSRSTTNVRRALTTVTSKKSGWANDPATASPLLGRRRQSAFHPHAFSSSSVPSLHVPSPGFISNPSSSFLSGVTTPGYGLPPAFLSKLLLLQACRSQLDLLRSLQDISTRLVLVPKPARLSSLRAELTVLNHGLPRGCSLGMPSRNYHPIAPPSSDKAQKRIQFKPQARIVRISPSESVVLNSADRAPFVIHVEVLETDLDFDPDRRQNAEDLRRALQEREGRSSSSIGGGAVKGNGHGLVGGPRSSTSDLSGARKNSMMVSRGSFDHALERQRFSSAGASSPSLLASSSSKDPPTLSPSRAVASKVPSVLDNEGDISLASSKTSKSSISQQRLEVEIFEEPEGEMDLVEQLYGDVSIHDAPFSPREVEEKEIHNRSVDEQAWARASTPIPTDTPAEETLGMGMIDPPIDRPLTPLMPSNTRPPLSASSSSSPAVPTWSKPGGRSVSSRPAISIDDYADRMRMAAVMLAQLDASQAATRGVVAKGTAAAGTLVGLPVATVAGIGGVVGAGLGAVASRLPFGSNKMAVTGAALSAAAALNSEGQVGQASSGTMTTTLDTTSAADGSSAVAGQPPLMSGVTTTPTPSAPQTRARLLAPAEATMIRERIMSEMMALEEERMARMREDGRARSGWTQAVSSSGNGGLEDGAVVMRAVNKDDPSGAVFRESFADKTARIRAASPYGHLANWNVISVIVKTGADLRQEQFAIQLVKEFGRIWAEEKCPSWVCYFRILVTSEQSGLMETITDAVSIHSIKKDAYTRTAADGTQVFTSFTLYDHFIDYGPIQQTYGSPSSGRFRKAQDAFVKSLASYSVICYLLQLKDRHNGNILVDRDGHLIHIDFGFLLSNSPGSLGFEMAPFKLPQDYIDILGGYESDKFLEFKHLFKRSFRAARKHAERIITLVELMQKDSKLDCFANGELTSQQLRERFMLSLTSAQIDEYSEKLIINAATSSFTRLYE
ncbi:BQ5605_C018g08600 [Microbotryum silenes-dioicae]|uniref:1-phosphatidylinositol 4-kinase n=1 Tax=Microbotryum silenes-dioicae TaxID=796604 RepID=A0A2X0LWG3_9BASI|nr:BQ5605_C018g08600 [Microbotryum silenes-dioicae]